MPRSSTLVAGFRTALRQPALLASEIAWRWALGVAAWLILVFTFFTYLHGLTVNRADWLLFRSKVPPLMAQAIRNIFSGSGPQLLRAAAVLLPAISLMWIFAASLGRWASLRAMIQDHRGRYRTVLGLHFLRAAAALAAWIGYLGALLIAGLVASRGQQDRPGLFLLIFFLIAIVVAFFHWRVRWYLFLANILSVRDGRDTFGAVSAAFEAYRQRRGRFWTLGLAMSAIRLFVIIGVTVVSLAPMAVIPGTAWLLLVIILAIITLLYFVIVDFLFVARLAAYVEILRDDLEPASAPPLLAPVEPAPPSSIESGLNPQANDIPGPADASAIGAADV